MTTTNQKHANVNVVEFGILTIQNSGAFRVEVESTVASPFNRADIKQAIQIISRVLDGRKIQKHRVCSFVLTLSIISKDEGLGLKVSG